MAEDLSRPLGEIIAVGARPAGGGRIELAEAPKPGEPTMRWLSHAHSIDDIEKELARIWAQPNLMVEVEGERGGRHIAARTSVMNLVVVARQPEVGERAAETISRLTGRHPSRTLVVLSADPDGPPWLEARIQAHCVLPRADAPETCTEMIFLTAGGETGRHLTALVEPLLVHDLPVTVWWPGEPPLDRIPARGLLGVTDRLVVDGSTWAGDGLHRLHQLATLYDDFPRLSIRDFALVRQSRWREAIASVFDMPDMLPYLTSIRRIAVTYGTHDETGAPGTTNVVKPLYHVGVARIAAWDAGRLAARSRRLEARRPAAAGREGAAPPRSLGAVCATARTRSRSSCGRWRRRCPPGRRSASSSSPSAGAPSFGPTSPPRPTTSTSTRGRTASRSSTARSRRPRRGDVDLLGEALETGGRDPLAVGTIRKAAELIGPGSGHRE